MLDIRVIASRSNRLLYFLLGMLLRRQPPPGPFTELWKIGKNNSRVSGHEK
jgi:hypothetical protein